MRACEIITTEGPGKGMFLNAAKSEVWNPCGVVPGRLTHFKALEAEGFELLGSPIGSKAFCRRYFAGKMKKYREVWANIQKLEHLQTQALLLRYCASFCKVVHLFRTVPPHLLSAEFAQFDQEFRTAIESIIGRTSDFTWSFMGLGCKKGGLGLRSSQLHSLGGYLASFHSASRWIKARFQAINEADITGRIDFLSEVWTKSFGKMPESLLQHFLSEATDLQMLPLLLASPACPPKTLVTTVVQFLEVPTLSLAENVGRQCRFSDARSPALSSGSALRGSVSQTQLSRSFRRVRRSCVVLQDRR